MSESRQLILSHEAVLKIRQWQAHVDTAKKPASDQAAGGWYEESRSLAVEFARLCAELLKVQRGPSYLKFPEGEAAPVLKSKRRKSES